MGQRHNRKRTRSRPRHRDRRNHSRNVSFALPPTTIPPSSLGWPSFAARAADHWDQQYNAWQNRARQHQMCLDEIEAERLRIFGGEAGDEVSLCEPMLRVVYDLFDDIDYVDP